jgi:hypothetical protein
VRVDESFIAQLYDAHGPFRGVLIPGLAAWVAGAIAFFAAGSVGGTIPALVVSVCVYLPMLYTRRR